MTIPAYCKDKLSHLLFLALALAFTAVFSSVLGVSPGAAVFLCLVLLLCGLLPLVFEGARKVSFYRHALGRLDALEEKYLLCELLDEPTFAEGAVFCATMRALGKSMTERVNSAERDMAEYREYIETWVHEAKTPIASARLLLENDPGAHSAPLEDELFRLDGCVEQALFYARSGAVEKDYLVKAMPLRAVCAAGVKKYARPLITAGFQVDLEGLGATGAVAYSDPKWVEFILGQLISNAVKYRSSRPKLTFTQTIADAAVTLHVRDNGVGIPAADLPRVFEKGFTGRNGRSDEAKSTGMGLYLTQKLCTRLGLGLALSSEEGMGTTVFLTFPRGKFHLAE